MDRQEQIRLIKERVNKNVSDINQSINNINTIADKFETAADLAQNADYIISDIEKQFNQYTGIFNKKDQAFLWVAVGLQCVRWIFQPQIDVMDKVEPDKSDRVTADEGKKLENKENSDWYNKNKDKEAKEGKYLSWQEYFTNAVPYDAMKGTEDIFVDGVGNDEVNFCGKNHHSATLGHDPILGYIFGTFNIMTSTITFHRWNLLSRIVDYPNVTKQRIFFREIIKQVVESEKEDKLRIPAAVARQALHIQSDKYTKIGLPIPMLNAKKQQELLNKGWNSKELDKLMNELNISFTKNIKTVNIQLVISSIINIVIFSLHNLMYDENTDGEYDLYSVRTSKIIKYSNLIADGVNLGAVSAGLIAGLYSGDKKLIKESVSHMDIGGYINTINSIIYNKKIQNQIEEEFLSQHWSEYVKNKLRSGENE